MILTRLSDYLRQHRRVSLNDMANGVDSTPEAIAGMLYVLERKGRVQRLPAGSACATPSCCKCDPTAQIIYEWVES